MIMWFACEELLEDPAARLDWLESQLVGARLGEVIAELQAAGSAEPEVSLSQTLAGAEERVLQVGLNSLDETQIKQLMRQPRLLIELQELILIHGSEYWRRRGEPVELRDMVTEAWQRLPETLRTMSSEEATADPKGFSRRGPYLLLTAALAASLFLIMAPLTGWWRTTPNDASPWGWSSPDALDERSSAAEYLQHLALRAEDWFGKRPDSATELAQRLFAFRQGCNRLILAEHRPLTVADQRWLSERCRTWAKRLDEQLQALEQTQDTQAVLDMTDSIVHGLVKALHERANNVTPPPNG